MLLFAEAKVTVDRRGRVSVSGSLERHRARIATFIGELGLRRVSVSLRKGKYRFRGSLDGRMEQRLRNFLVNECPLPKR